MINAFRLNGYLDDSIRSQGDILQIGLSESRAFEIAVRTGFKSNKAVYGLDETIPKKTEERIQSMPKREVNFFSNLDNILNLKSELCFIFMDLSSQTLIKEYTTKLWDKLSYGSTIFFKNYNERGGTEADRAIKSFLSRYKQEITPARQMMIQGIKERSLAVKCFPKNKKPEDSPYDKKITVATVLKSGGYYDVSYVNHIANSMKNNLTHPYEFICLTDCTEGFNNNVDKIIPFKHDFPKWWGKIELFQSNIFETERVFYLDLDTIIVKNIDHIVTNSENFFGLRDFYHQYGLGSGIMGWRCKDPLMNQIYEKFMENPTSNMNNHRTGDQEFIWGVNSNYVKFIQDFYPKEIVSYKKDCVDNRNNISIPPEASIVCFHGPPRPKSIKDQAIRKYWME